MFRAINDNKTIYSDSVIIIIFLFKFVYERTGLKFFNSVLLLCYTISLEVYGPLANQPCVLVEQPISDLAGLFLL